MICGVRLFLKNSQKQFKGKNVFKLDKKFILILFESEFSEHILNGFT